MFSLPYLPQTLMYEKKISFGPHEPQNSLSFKLNCLGHIFITLTSCYRVCIRYLTTFFSFRLTISRKIFLKSKMISFAYKYFDMHCVSHFYLILDIGIYPITHVEKMHVHVDSISLVKIAVLRAENFLCAICVMKIFVTK